MSRQTEHYDKANDAIAQLDGAFPLLHVIDCELESMQRDINHGLAHVQTALDTLNTHDDRYMLPAETMLDARNELLAWLDRMGVTQVARQPVDPTADECDGDCPDGEAAEAIEADRDELSATIERLYDGIDAALLAMGTGENWADADARREGIRILRNLRPVTS